MRELVCSPDVVILAMYVTLREFMHLTAAG